MTTAERIDAIVKGSDEYLRGFQAGVEAQRNAAAPAPAGWHLTTAERTHSNWCTGCKVWSRVRDVWRLDLCEVCEKDLRATLAPAPAGWQPIAVCVITGRIAGDADACGDCDPCSAAHAVPEVVKRLLAEKEEWRQKYADAMANRRRP